MSPRRVPVLETTRLLLTLPSDRDAEELCAYVERNREHLRPWSPPEPPGPIPLVGSLRRIENIQREFQSGTSARFWLRELGNGSGPFIGAVTLSNIVLGPFRACYLGYQLDVAHIGQGFMHEALGAVIEYAFVELRLHRIMANYVPENERSARVLRRSGFVVEGYARDYLFVGGRFRDHVLTSLTNADLLDAERLCTPA